MPGGCTGANADEYDAAFTTMQRHNSRHHSGDKVAYDGNRPDGLIELNPKSVKDPNVIHVSALCPPSPPNTLSLSLSAWAR